MNIGNKDTFYLLNNQINLYKDWIEILNNILELYKGFICLIDEKGKNIYFDIDYSINVINKCKIQWIKVFDNILIFNHKTFGVNIEEIKIEDFNYIIHEIEKFLLKQYDVFLDSWQLEALTYIERNSEVKAIDYCMDKEYEKDMQSFNREYIKVIIEEAIDKVLPELDSIIKVFNAEILMEKNKLKITVAHEDSMEPAIFFHEVNLGREIVLNSIDNFQEKIEILIKENLVHAINKEIDIKIEENLGNIIGKYKIKLNEYYISTLYLKEEAIKHKYKKKISNKNTYKLCAEVLEVERTYLELLKIEYMKYIRLLIDQARATLQNIFDLEFHLGIYDLKSNGDFENLIEAYKIKSDFILGNIIDKLFKNFISKYLEVFFLALKNRRQRVKNLYIFKPINYMGDFNIHEPSKIIDLQRLLDNIYGYYDLEVNDYQYNELKKMYINLNGEVKEAVEKFKVSLDIYYKMEENNKYFHIRKVEMYNSITLLREELWSKLNYTFDNILKEFSSIIEDNIKLIDNEIKLYKHAIDDEKK